MGSLLVVTGPPGAGKSSVAQVLAAQLSRSVLVEGDAFYAFLASGAIAPWSPDSHAQNVVVGRAAGAATAVFAADYETFYDGVLGPWQVDDFMHSAGIQELDDAVVLPPVEVCAERVATRHGHGFSDEAAMRKMHAEFSKATIDSRHVLTDVMETPEEMAALIADRRVAGALRHAV